MGLSKATKAQRQQQSRVNAIRSKAGAMMSGETLPDKQADTRSILKTGDACSSRHQSVGKNFDENFSEKILIPHNDIKKERRNTNRKAAGRALRLQVEYKRRRLRHSEKAKPRAPVIDMQAYRERFKPDDD